MIAADGEQVGVVSLNDALDRAQKVELDLVEIAPEAEPPVCRVMDYGKYLFEKGKGKRKQKKAKRIQVKEIKMRPGTDEHDRSFKLRKAIKFLQEGNKVKITIRFRGREMAHQELGMDMLQQIEIDLAEFGSVEQAPKLEGRQMMMVVGSKKK